MPRSISPAIADAARPTAHSDARITTTGCSSSTARKSFGLVELQVGPAHDRLRHLARPLEEDLLEHLLADPLAPGR